MFDKLKRHFFWTVFKIKATEIFKYALVNAKHKVTSIE